MASPSSTTTQSQGGSDVSVTQTLQAGRSESLETSAPVELTTLEKRRPDFSITFVFKPLAPPTGTLVP